MDSLSQRSTQQLTPPEGPGGPPRVKKIFAHIRSWLGTRLGRITLLVVVFLLGFVGGVVALLLYALSISSDSAAIVTQPSPQTGSIVVQVSNTYISELIQRNVQSAGLPGKVQNVRVSLAHNSPIVVTGDDVFTLVGVPVKRRFTIKLQPYVTLCQLRMHVLSADLSGIPVTGFVSTFEGRINQQLQVKVSNLPQGFVYCTSGVRTETQGMFIIYSATPQ